MKTFLSFIRALRVVLALSLILDPAWAQAQAGALIRQCPCSARVDSLFTVQTLSLNLDKNKAYRNQDYVRHWSRKPLPPIKKEMTDDDYQSIVTALVPLLEGPPSDTVLVETAFRSPKHFKAVTNHLIKLLVFDHALLRSGAKHVLMSIMRRLQELPPDFVIPSSFLDVKDSPAQSLLWRIVRFFLANTKKFNFNPARMPEPFRGIDLLSIDARLTEAQDFLFQIVQVIPQDILKNLQAGGRPNYAMEETYLNRFLLLETQRRSSLDAAGTATGGVIGNHFARLYGWMLDRGAPLWMVHLFAAPILQTFFFKGLFVAVPMISVLIGGWPDHRFEAFVFLAAAAAWGSAVYASHWVHPLVYRGLRSTPTPAGWKDFQTLLLRDLAQSAVMMAFFLQALPAPGELGARYSLFTLNCYNESILYGALWSLALYAAFNMLALMSGEPVGTATLPSDALQPRDRLNNLVWSVFLFQRIAGHKIWLSTRDRPIVDDVVVAPKTFGRLALDLGRDPSTLEKEINALLKTFQPYLKTLPNSDILASFERGGFAFWEVSGPHGQTMIQDVIAGEKPKGSTWDRLQKELAGYSHEFEALFQAATLEQRDRLYPHQRKVLDLLRQDYLKSWIMPLLGLSSETLTQCMSTIRTQLTRAKTAPTSAAKRAA